MSLASRRSNSLFIDIHSHIIPGIDDGAQDKETALMMLREAAENNTGHIIATPHFISGSMDNTIEAIVEKCRALQQDALKEGIDIMIYPGMEIFISSDIPVLIDKNVIGTLNGSEYILVELPISSIPVYTDDVLYKLQLKGLTPVIAHPERNIEIAENPGKLYSLVNRGMMVQVNAGSLIGIYGRKVKKAAINLIHEDLVHFIASDAHTCGKRSSSGLKKAAQIIERAFGSETVQMLLRSNAQDILK
jgi:protein-tyrosine phosphatase